MSAEYCEDHDMLMDDLGCDACNMEIALETWPTWEGGAE